MVSKANRIVKYPTTGLESIENGGEFVNASSRWPLSEIEQSRLIQRLTTNLPLLRAKLDITQEEISEIVGISRQTYSAIESGKRVMSWQVFLSLVLFFDANKATHSLLHHLECFPNVLIDKTFEQDIPAEIDNVDSNKELLQMLSKLDEQALHSVKTVLMVEYARCSKIPGEAVIKAFDGSGFVGTLTSNNKELDLALDRIKMRSNDDES